jgi:cell division septum initiation protein DivIVA
MQTARERSGQMTAAQLRSALEDATKQTDDQSKYFDQLVDENSQLEMQIAEFKEELEEARKAAAEKAYTIQSLQHQLTLANEGQSDGIDVAALVEMACRDVPPLPSECLDLIEKAYAATCIVLPTARSSAEDMGSFIKGRELLDLLRRLVTRYRNELMTGGDSRARKVFGKGEFAAKESETVMKNREMRRQRTFPYDGEDVEMFRHLKVGNDDDVTRTIRVHFHWDSSKQKIIIGYCGKHLLVSSY